MMIFKVSSHPTNALMYKAVSQRETLDFKG